MMARGIERPMDNCDLPVVADSLEDRRVQAQDFRLASCERVLIRGPRRIGSVADPYVRYAERRCRRLVEQDPHEPEDRALTVHDVAVFVQPDDIIGKMLFEISHVVVVVGGDARLDQFPVPAVAPARAPR